MLSPHDAHCPSRSKNGQTTFFNVISNNGPRLRAWFLTARLHDLHLHRTPQTRPQCSPSRCPIRVLKVGLRRLIRHRDERKRIGRPAPPHHEPSIARHLRLVQPRFELAKTRFVCHRMQHRVRFRLALERNRLGMFPSHRVSCSIAADITSFRRAAIGHRHFTREIVNARLRAREQNRVCRENTTAERPRPSSTQHRPRRRRHIRSL